MSDFKIGGWLTFRAFDKDGSPLWEEKIAVKNGIPDAALTDALSVHLGGGTQKATWYIGLIDNAGFGSLAATDTSSSHAGWNESTNYNEASRQTIAFGAAAAKTIASSSSCTFTITSSTTLKGAFVISNNTKGGATGILFATGAFASTQTIGAGQALRVDYSCSAASS